MNLLNIDQEIHIMLDLETLGIKPGCSILSIGASTFLLPDREVRDNFGVTIDYATQDLMDKADEATIKWWQEQSEEAIAATFKSDNKHIKEALINFVAWIEQIKQRRGTNVVNIWGKGATFDEPVIVEAMRRYDIPVPWTFRSSMCFRTLEKLGKLMGVETPEFVGTKHVAMFDAIHQADHAIAIFKRITGER